MLKGRAGIQAGALGIADQVLLSATNLAIGLALAREMAPGSFGIYVVTFALLLIGASIQICLVTDPLVVLGSTRNGEAQGQYFGSAWRLQLWISVGLALLTGVASLIAGGLTHPGSELPGALAGLALAIVPLQAQMFCRAVFFARLSPGLVLFNDLLLSILRVGMLAWLVMSAHLSTFSVMATAGLAGLFATGAGLLACRDLLASGHTALATTWREHWRFGRWLLATSGAYWCSGQAPALLASTMIAPVAAAIIKACQYLVAPLGVAFMGLDGILAPRAARIRSNRGPDAARRFLMLVAGGCALSVILYAAILLPVTEPLMRWLYRGQYAGHVTLVGVLLLDALLAAVGRAPTLELKVAGQTRSIFTASLAGAVAGIAALVGLVPSMGVLGVAIAAPVSSGVTLAALLVQGAVRSRKPVHVENPLVAGP